MYVQLSKMEEKYARFQRVHIQKYVYTIYLREMSNYLLCDYLCVCAGLFGDFSNMWLKRGR